MILADGAIAQCALPYDLLYEQTVFGNVQEPMSSWNDKKRFYLRKSAREVNTHCKSCWLLPSCGMYCPSCHYGYSLEFGKPSNNCKSVIQGELEATLWLIYELDKDGILEKTLSDLFSGTGA